MLLTLCKFLISYSPRLKDLFIVAWIAFRLGFTFGQTSDSANQIVHRAIEQKVSVYGFVKYEAIFNSRRNVEAREGTVNLFPFDKFTETDQPYNINTKDYKDFNAQPNFHMVSIFSRIGISFGGLTILGAKTYGAIEADFMGTANGQEELLRLRHAYVEFDWERQINHINMGTKLLIGQFWNPMWVLQCFPGVASTTAGMPFNPFGWVPQIRVTQQINSFSFMGIIYSQLIFANVIAGAGNGYSRPSTDESRYSGIPNFNFQIHFSKNKVDAGIGLDITTIRPNLISSAATTYADSMSSTNLTSVSYIGFVKIRTKPIIIKAYSIIGANLTQFAGIGGFAQYLDGTIYKYVAQQTHANWFEVIAPSTKKIKIEPALWIGYLYNCGINKDIPNMALSKVIFVGRGITKTRTLDDFWRFCSRVDVYAGKFKISVEYSYDLITYGNTDVKNFKIKHDNDSFKFFGDNHRINLATIFNF